MWAKEPLTTETQRHRGNRRNKPEFLRSVVPVLRKACSAPDFVMLSEARDDRQVVPAQSKHPCRRPKCGGIFLWRDIHHSRPVTS